MNVHFALNYTCAFVCAFIMDIEEVWPSNPILCKNIVLCYLPWGENNTAQVGAGWNTPVFITGY